MWKITLKIVKWTVGILLSLMIITTLLLLIFRKNIENYALSQLNKYLKTEVYVNDMDITFWRTFPNISIEFQKVLITDNQSIENTLPDTLLFANRLNLNLNTLDFWRGNYNVKSIDVDKARIGLRIFKSGEVNYDIIKSDSTKKDENFRFSLNSVHFKDLSFSYDNVLSDQHYKIFAKTLKFKGDFKRDLYDMSTSGDIILKEMKSKAVVLIHDKQAEFGLSINVNRKNKSFILQRSEVKIEHIPLILEAQLISDSIKLRLEGKNLSLTDITNNIQSSSANEVRKMDGTGKVTFWLDINGKVGGEIQPLVESGFTIKNGSLTESIKHSKLSNIQLKGMFSNHNGLNEELAIQEFSVNSKYGDFSGNVTIIDFNAPEVKARLKGNIDLSLVQSLFPMKAIKSLSGGLKMDASCHFKMNQPKINPSNINIYESKGDFELQHVNIAFESSAPSLTNLNGNIILLKDDAAFDNLNGKTGKTDFSLSGNMQHIVAYFSGEQQLLVDAILESNAVYSSDFYTNQHNVKQTEDIGNYLISKGIKGTLNLNIYSLHLEQHLFTNVSTRIAIDDRLFSSQAIQFTHLGTNITGDISISEKLPGLIEVSGSMNADDINLKSVFKEWNNFDQKNITSDNISGDAAIGLNYYLPYNYQKGLDMDKIEAKVFIKVTNGNLKNVATFKSITQDMRKNKLVNLVLNKHIDLFEQKLNNLSFETMENTFTIDKGRILIPSMKIRSSAIDIDLLGWQAFNNDLDYHLDFRFRDLKTIDTETEFGEELDDQTGIRLFLHLYGNVNNLKFTWDKEMKKEYQQEKWKEEHQTIKSMLKQEIGAFKNDSSVNAYVKEKKPESKIDVIFGDSTNQNDDIHEERKKKKGFFDKLKQQSKEEKNSTLEFEVDPE